MRRRKVVVLFVVIGVLSSACGCATFMEYGKLEKKARGNYQRGSYDAAVFDCAAALRLKPDYGKAQALVKDAFRMAVDAHESRIRELSSSSSKSKWDDIVSEYEALIKLNQAIKGLPTIRDKRTGEVVEFEVTDYTQAMAEAKENAAEAHYQEGIRLAQYEDIDSQKQAAKEFREAEEFCPGYRDAANLYERARRAGLKRIAIIPFEDRTGVEGKYGSLSDMIVDDVVSDIMKDPGSMEFLEIVSRDQLAQVLQEQDLGQVGIVDSQTAVDIGKVLGVHEIVTGKINQIIYIPPATVTRNESREKEVATGTEEYTDSSGKVQQRTVYGTVRATVYIHRLTASASISGSYAIIEAVTARLRKSESFSETDSFECQWAEFSGDERALNYDDKKYGPEIPVPVEEEMVTRAARKLAASLARTLKDYAR